MPDTEGIVAQASVSFAVPASRGSATRAFFRWRCLVHGATAELDRVKRQGSDCPLCRRHRASHTHNLPVVPASAFACAPSTFNRQTTASTGLNTRAPRHSPALSLGHINKIEQRKSGASHSFNATLSPLGEPQAHRATTTRLPHHSPQSLSLPLPRRSSPT